MKQELCVVCRERLDEVNSAVCGECGGRYHLIMKTDHPGKDCGDVWLNEAYLALQFACFNCLPAGSASGETAGASDRRVPAQGEPAKAPRRPGRSARARGPRIRRRYRKR